MSPRSLVRSRPSASLVVSFLALFVALGGAGWAAFRLPPHSVGNAQLKNFSVGNAKLRPNSVGASKIIPGSVGARQVNSKQVQLRLTTGCPIGAIESIGQRGRVTCAPLVPHEFGNSASNKPIGPGALSTLVTGVQLPGGAPAPTYLVLGYVHWTVSGTPSTHQSVDVQCTLQVQAAKTSGESIAELDPNQTTQAGTIPIVLPGTIEATHDFALIACGYSATPATPAPTVSASATLNAIETASNG